MPVPTEKLVLNTITPPVEEYGSDSVDASPVADLLALDVAVQDPVLSRTYNEPGSFAPDVDIIDPTVVISTDPAVGTVALDVEIQEPSVQIDGAPVADVCTLDVEILASTLIIDVQSFVALLPGTLTLNVYGPNMLNPSVGVQYVRLTRFISDPVRSGGCPQCGTFLYQEYGAKQIKSEPILYGRNFDIEGEDKFIRCARCNWPVKPKRTPPHRKGAYTGWGLKYDEYEVIENEPFIE